MTPARTDAISTNSFANRATTTDAANLPINLFLSSPDEDLRPLRAVYGDRFPAAQEKSVVREPAPSGLLRFAG